MTFPSIRNDDAWRRKAQALDSYRWALLRSKHGTIGCFIRMTKDICVDYYLGMMARLRTRPIIESTSSSIIVLHGTPKLLSMQRKCGLIEELRTFGHTVFEKSIEPLGVAVKNRQLCHPPQNVPLRYYAYAAYAEWLSRNANPRIILGDRNGSLVSPFLRLSLNSQGKKLIQLAHATTVERSRRLGMIDYDFYFLFGHSSLASLKKRTLRFGSTKVVLSGSHLIDHSYSMTPPQKNLNRLLILGVGPDKEKRLGYIATYDMLMNWAAAHPDTQVYFKPHYRSKGTFWAKAAEENRNIEILSSKTSLAQALQASSVVVNIMSNAALEASLAQRPLAYANASGEEDILEQARFFGGTLDNATRLEVRLDWINENYEEAIDQSRAFANYHLAHGVDGQKTTAELIDSVFKESSIESIPLEGTVG